MSVVVTAAVADVRAILDSVGWPSPPGPTEPAAEPVLADVLREERPDHALAAMLGLPGAVAIGDQLRSVANLAPPVRADHGRDDNARDDNGRHDNARDDGSAALHYQLATSLIRRRAAIRKRIQRRYAEAFSGLRALPGPEATLELIRKAGILTDRGPEALAHCAHHIADRYRFMFSATLGVMRKEVYWLRDDILRGLGTLPHAAPLLALDRVLEATLEQATLRSHRNLETGLTARFAEALIAAFLALPTEHPEAAVEAWFRRRGFVARFLHDCRRLSWALLDTEWNRLRGLTDACCGAIPQSALPAPQPHAELQQTDVQQAELQQTEVQEEAAVVAREGKEEP